MQSPKFHNTNLQLCVEKSKEKIDVFREKLDKISSDIKNLEAILKNLGIPLKHKYLFKSEAQSKCFIVWWDNRIQLDIQQEESVDNIKPLIDAKIEIRIEAWNHLDKFYLDFLNKIATYEISVQ